MYEEGRRLYTEEINAAVRGARAAGATEVVVMDCHGAGEGWNFNSLVPDLLDPGCEYVVQREWTEYSGFLEAGCDAALLVGILTERDLLKAVAGGFATDARVRDWMTHHPETLDSDDSTEHAAALMIHGGFRHLPVVDGADVLGIISIRDLVPLVLEDSAPRGA